MTSLEEVDQSQAEQLKCKPCRDPVEIRSRLQAAEERTIIHLYELYASWKQHQLRRGSSWFRQCPSRSDAVCKGVLFGRCSGRQISCSLAVFTFELSWSDPLQTASYGAVAGPHRR
eukprot:TRINITY_DN20790_c0_g1_i1.p1 TRINITY_DN20790_c0_g1~~TRINITY_DN20790_c0_g1_i1.p1  ORF type:complete len:116 (+),score=1.53 TRINITY_DN20790_c0_g1_i1:49-396(+)